MNDLGRYFAPDDARDGLRKLGGLLIGVGALVLFFRKGSDALGSAWGDFALFLVLAIPCVVLYGLGLVGRRFTPLYESWQGVFLTFGVILLPLALFQFVQLIDGTPSASLNVAWIFAVTAAAALVAAILGNMRLGVLLAGLAVIVAWLALWNKILSNGLLGDFGTFRGLLVVIALALVGAAAALTFRERRPGTPLLAPPPLVASELVTAAGIAGVLAGSLGVARFSSLGSVPTGAPLPSPSLFWDIVLLVVSVLLIAYGTRFAARGPAYIGGIGLFIFVLQVGADLDDDTPYGGLGWPLVLLILGALLVLASLFATGGLRRRRVAGAPTEPGGYAAAPPATSPRTEPTAPPPPPAEPPPPPPPGETRPGP